MVEIDVLWLLLIDILKLLPYMGGIFSVGMLIYIFSDFSSKMGTNKKPFEKKI
jgi:hypothetical protein